MHLRFFYRLFARRFSVAEETHDKHLPHPPPGRSNLWLEISRHVRASTW